MLNESSDKPETFDRRKFFRTSGLTLGALAVTGLNSSISRAGEAWPTSAHDLVGKGATILFQGDSITDAGRSRERANVANDQVAMGSGYAWLAAAELLVDRPNADLKIYNQGISGNKVF